VVGEERRRAAKGDSERRDTRRRCARRGVPMRVTPRCRRLLSPAAMRAVALLACRARRRLYASRYTPRRVCRLLYGRRSTGRGKVGSVRRWWQWHSRGGGSARRRQPKCHKEKATRCWHALWWRSAAASRRATASEAHGAALGAAKAAGQQRRAREEYGAACGSMSSIRAGE